MDAEINAAWGQAVLLLHTIDATNDSAFLNQGIVLVSSRVEVMESRVEVIVRRKDMGAVLMVAGVRRMGMGGRRGETSAGDGIAYSNGTQGSVCGTRHGCRMRDKCG